MIKKLTTFLSVIIGTLTVGGCDGGGGGGSAPSAPYLSFVLTDSYNSSNNTLFDNFSGSLNSAAFVQNLTAQEAVNDGIALTSSESMSVSFNSNLYPLLIESASNLPVYVYQGNAPVVLSPNTNSYTINLTYHGTNYTANFSNFDNSNWYVLTKAVCTANANNILYQCMMSTTKTQHLPPGVTVKYTYLSSTTTASECVGKIATTTDSNATVVSFASCNITPTSGDSVFLEITSIQQLSVTPNSGMNMEGIYDLNSSVTPTAP